MFYASGTTGRPKGILPSGGGGKFGTGLVLDHTLKNSFGLDTSTVYLSTLLGARWRAAIR